MNLKKIEMMSSPEPKVKNKKKMKENAESSLFF
jgi:hypothetical protein